MAETTQKRARDADAIDLTEEASPEKKRKVALNDIAKEFVCPISHELPTNPVYAEDGQMYDRGEISKWFGTKPKAKSPTTGAIIRTRLIPATQVRNAIEKLVNSGDLADEIVEAWREKLELEAGLKQWLSAAEGGDGEAMWKLGLCYGQGENGVAQDAVQARAWYERSAEARDPRGMALFGKYLLEGMGGPPDNARGIMLVTEAAHLGSDFGAMSLGHALLDGCFGLSKDPVMARFWLKKVVDGECAHKTLVERNITNAAEWIRELDARSRRREMLRQLSDTSDDDDSDDDSDEDESDSDSNSDDSSDDDIPLSAFWRS